MFNENSGLVKIWVRWIDGGDKTLADVPNLSNLQDVVSGLVNAQ